MMKALYVDLILFCVGFVYVGNVLVIVVIKQSNTFYH